MGLSNYRVLMRVLQGYYKGSYTLGFLDRDLNGLLSGFQKSGYGKVESKF